MEYKITIFELVFMKESRSELMVEKSIGKREKTINFIKFD